jgi:predicted chitinase
MDANTLADAMLNRDGVDYAKWVDGCNAAMTVGQITNVNRAAMFLGQCGAESGGLQWMTELASGDEYEGRLDLGNTQPGDGPRFKGRGPIQITGRNNYANLSRWACDQHLVATTTFFVDHPDQLAEPRFVWLGPVWYWTVARSTLNQLSDDGDIVAATRAINGGTNGLAGRTDRWKHCLSLGTAILPTPSTERDEIDMATKAELQAVVETAMKKFTGAPLCIYFINSGAKNNPNAVYAVVGSELLYLNPPTYQWIGSPPAHAMDLRSSYWKLPVVPGTPDYRGKAA